MAIALKAAGFLGRSRALAAFGGLVAAAGVIHELRRRRERAASSA
jgi:hypothetical protein